MVHFLSSVCVCEDMFSWSENIRCAVTCLIIFAGSTPLVLGFLFSLFLCPLQGGKNEPPPSGDAFVCNNFSLSAPKQTLFDNARFPNVAQVEVWKSNEINSIALNHCTIQQDHRINLFSLFATALRAGKFTKASITIVQGHRYGILGPNGQVG